MDDSTWTSVENEASWDLLDIWGETDFPLYKYAIVGNPGPVICYDGSQWTQTIGSAAMNLNAVWGVSFTDLYAVGDNGTILHKPATPETGTINRLLCEHRKTETGKTIYRIEYLFDNNQAKNGNIHKIIYDGNNVTEFQYNEMNELTTITHPDSTTETLTYDNNGNLTQTIRNGETTSYQWDCFDRLLKVTLPPQNGGANGETVDFNYDEDGMLIKMDSEGTEQKFTQKGRFATRELVKNGQGNWETSATHIIHRTMLSSYLNSNSVKPGNTGDAVFYHTDHLGSVRLITDQNGNIVDSSTTDAYGNPLPHPDSLGNKGAKMLSKFNFVGTHGIKYVEKVKLHNMRARWYNHLLSRFISNDYLKEGLNYYLYVDNKPLKTIDPTGLSKIYLKDNQKIRNEIIFTTYNKFDTGWDAANGKLLDLQNIKGATAARIQNNHDIMAKDSCEYMMRILYYAKNLFLRKTKGCGDYDDFVDILSVIFLGVAVRENVRAPITIKDHTYIIDTNRLFVVYKPYLFEKGIWHYGTGFKKKYTDPGNLPKETDQVFHFMGYVVMGYKVGSDEANLFNFAHEFLDPTKDKKARQGMSIEDWNLGCYAIDQVAFLLRQYKSLGYDNQKSVFKRSLDLILKEINYVCKSGKRYVWM